MTAPAWRAAVGRMQAGHRRMARIASQLPAAHSTPLSDEVELQHEHLMELVQYLGSLEARAEYWRNKALERAC